MPALSEQALVAVDAYASARGLTLTKYAPHPIYAGTPFSYGKPLGVTNVFRGSGSRAMEFGNASYATRVSDEDPLAWDFGYLAMKLDRALPHVSLQAKGSGMLWDTSRGAAIGPALEQRMTLEGNFNDYFYFYCPEGYETDALYVFTPDVMALFIDEMAAFDAEIVDDWLIVYSGKPFAPADFATYDRLLRIAGLVGAKVLRRTDGYRDGRVGDFSLNVVGKAGRRLSRRQPWQPLAIAPALGLAISIAVGLPFLVFFFAVWFTVRP